MKSQAYSFNREILLELLPTPLPYAYIGIGVESFFRNI